MFLDRDDILNLYLVTNLPLPDAALPEISGPWAAMAAEPPF
ncbi:hypothetical protein [Antrihabitans cavernicola]|nr:hypothetical protein [Spelaeibacter cavernicola]